jgi:hypothetical protein
MWYVFERNLFKREFRMTFFIHESVTTLPTSEGTLAGLFMVVIDDGDDGKGLIIMYSIVGAKW